MTGTDNSKVTIEKPDDMLGKRALIPGTPGIDYEAIERAEKALSDLSSNFESWMGDEIRELAAARDAVLNQGRNAETIVTLFHTAHDIKGQAATLGFPLAGPVAASLCKLALDAPDPSRIPQMLIDQHVDAIKAIVNEDVRDTQNHTAYELTQRLTYVTNDFLDQENRRAGIDPNAPRNADTTENAASGS